MLNIELVIRVVFKNSAPKKDAALRIATWNVLYREVSTRLPLLAKTLRAVDADVVLLQETNPGHVAELADAIGLRVRACGVPAPSGPANTVAILSKLTPQAVNELSYPDGSGYLLSCEFDIEGARIRIGTTHLRATHLAARMGLDASYRARAQGDTVAELRNPEIATSVAARLQQLEQIRFWQQGWSPDAEIVTGDFNFLPDGVEYRTVTAWGMCDAWRAAPRLGSGATILERNPLLGDNPAAYAELRSELPGSTAPLDYTLDYQFFSGSIVPGKAWTIGEANADSDWPSDHLGLVVEYEVRG